MTQTAAAEALLAEFEGPWRDDTPVFGCCRKAMTSAVDNSDVYAVAPLGPTERVKILRDAVEGDLPGHLDAHRCCAGHLADLAFDLPDLLAPVDAS